MHCLSCLKHQSCSGKDLRTKVERRNTETLVRATRPRGVERRNACAVDSRSGRSSAREPLGRGNGRLVGGEGSRPGNGRSTALLQLRRIKDLNGTRRRDAQRRAQKLSEICG